MEKKLIKERFEYIGVKERLEDIGVNDCGTKFADGGIFEICSQVYGKGSLDVYHFCNALNVAVALHNGDVTKEQALEAIKPSHTLERA